MGIQGQGAFAYNGAFTFTLSRVNSLTDCLFSRGEQPKGKRKRPMQPRGPVFVDCSYQLRFQQFLVLLDSICSMKAAVLSSPLPCKFVEGNLRLKVSYQFVSTCPSVQLYYT